jgi:hypothetical protein
MRFAVQITLLAMLALIGCSERGTPDKKSAAAPSVIEPQLKALEQAKGVEKTLADQAEAQRKAIEDAEKR